jgi:hypothetical protein
LNELITDSVTCHVVDLLANPFDVFTPAAVELFGGQVCDSLGGHDEMLGCRHLVRQLRVAGDPRPGLLSD